MEQLPREALMENVDLGYTLLALLAVFIVFAFIFARAEGLTFFAPRSTRQIAGSAQAYCTGKCRLADGRCPLTDSMEPAVNCPLWRYIDEDMPTVLYGSPFSYLQTK
jgi:hypothetical protein